MVFVLYSGFDKVSEIAVALVGENSNILYFFPLEHGDQICSDTVIKLLNQPCLA